MTTSRPLLYLLAPQKLPHNKSTSSKRAKGFLGEGATGNSVSIPHPSLSVLFPSLHFSLTGVPLTRPENLGLFPGGSIIGCAWRVQNVFLYISFLVSSCGSRPTETLWSLRRLIKPQSNGPDLSRLCPTLQNRHTLFMTWLYF